MSAGRTPLVRAAVIEDQRENFEQVRFARAEKAGNPDTIGRQFGKVAVGENAKSFRHIAGDHIFLQLGLKIARIIGLDDAINMGGQRV